ncbi:ABC transporter ATP-binding protein [Philodulcilactobacillus myokoensis]|uniref:ABC transporter ATP-binding protein n=1 Tax=Philodulcilactobacillus myokoensis TaxID=2929573 RepID=A0A9W6ET77_9LACO|nr:ABC transporter ATP-binding protein [Philodulcilactobacillus myokoensis]GLB47510.1 ABC transporter ATP-binding protein [Philodulcilactobacillus myokoensis]
MTEIKINDLNQVFNHQNVLKNINLEFKNKAIYGLLGNNGVGKSTLMNLMTERILPTSGYISINGHNIHNNDVALQQMYLLNEDDMYSPSLKVRQIFNLTNEIYGNFNFKFAKLLSKKFDLNLSLKFGKLSTGYRTICKIIVAFCVPVKYVLLDEPTLGLDANHRNLFYEALINTYSHNPRTFIISSHLINEISKLLNYVIFINNGKIILNNSIEIIMKNSFAITGSKDDVKQYTRNLNVIGKRNLGKLSTFYVYDHINNQTKSFNIKIEKMNLQRLLICLSNIGKEG